jgi:hypothetical protein
VQQAEGLAVAGDGQRPDHLVEAQLDELDAHPLRELLGLRDGRQVGGVDGHEPHLMADSRARR